MNTIEIIDQIFKDPKTKYELSEFENLGKPIYEIINIYAKTITSGREAGKIKYFLKSFVPFPSGREEVQVYSEDGKSSPEEIVRQLWIYKLINYYGYRENEIEIEKSVYFGTEIVPKAADIVVHRTDKETPKVIVEVKNPKRKDGIEQLKSYLNAEGSPVGVWSNGSDKIILYRPYPREFEDTLTEIPKRDQEPKDVLEAVLSLGHLEKRFDFKKIILDLEELVLGSSGVDVFNEIFKIIFAKIWDEKEAEENRPNKEVHFKKFIDPQLTYERINYLFKRAAEEWPGIFKDNEEIELRKDHLQVCIGPIERKCFLGSNLRIMDDAFEYLLPTEAKKKKGQFFTPRYVIDMCIRILNPKRNEYIMDPACGSAGFLLHTMEWVYPTSTISERELRKSRYASKLLWGIDFEKRAAQTAKALMLIAGDGHSKIFGPDVDSLEPRSWFGTHSGQNLINELRNSRLLLQSVPSNESLTDEDKAWDYFEQFKFDVVMTNPPFAGEVKDRKQLIHYELAKPALRRAKNKQPKEERDVLFIERVLMFLKPGGRVAIILPQGKFNNSSLAFIREWILRKARLLAVVGLHQNTFKPHTGTKTSVLFIQKYTNEDLQKIEKVQQEVASSCPDYEAQIKRLLKKFEKELDVPEEKISENIAELIQEEFGEEEVNIEEVENEENKENIDEEELNESITLEEKIANTKEKIRDLTNQLIETKQKIVDLDDELEAIKLKHEQEIEIIKNEWSGTKKDLNVRLKPVKEKNKRAVKELNEKQKEHKKKLNAQIKSLEKSISETEYELKLLTNKGKLQLILENDYSLEKLKNRFIDAEVSKILDYPIFMAVSKKGGKNNSGEYEYILDEDGNIIEDKYGNPLINQDLVNYEITKEDLQNINSVSEEKLCIAEAFIKFAKKQNYSFWVK